MERSEESELVTEIDCENLILEGGLGFCTVYRTIVNHSPCVPNCPYHKKKEDFEALLYGNRICYEEQ